MKNQIERAEPSRGSPLTKFETDRAEVQAPLLLAENEKLRSGHVVLLEALQHAIRFLPHNLDEICRAGDCTRCKVLAESEAAIQQAERI